MDAVRPLILPANARLVSGDDGLVLVHDGDVILEQTLGLPLASLTCDGDLQVHTRATGTLLAGGEVQIMADADVDRLEGREVHLGPHTIQARVVVATELVVISPGARINVEILSAPRVVLAPGIKGRVRLLDTLEPVPQTALRGCHDIPAYEAAIGGAQELFEDLGVDPVSLRTGQGDPFARLAARSTAPSPGQRTDPEPPAPSTPAPEPEPEPMPAPSAAPPAPPSGLTSARPSATPPSSAFPTFSSRSSHPPLPDGLSGAPSAVPPAVSYAPPAAVDEDVDDEDTISVEAEAIEEEVIEEPSLETLATGAFEAIEDDGLDEIESIESVAFEAVPEPARQPAKRKRPPRTRAKHHAQVRKAWDRIAEAYGDSLPEGLQMMGEAVAANRTADVIRQLDAYWAVTLRDHMAHRRPPPREVVRAFLALHGLR